VRLAAIVVLLAITETGCAVGPRLSRARALPEGELEVVAGSSLSLVGSGQTKFPAGSLDSTVRVGVFEDFEVGVGLRGAWTPQIAVFGAGADAKIQLIDARTREEGFELAVDPGFNWDAIFSAGELGHFFTFSLPVVLGLNIEGEHQLILAPAFIDTWVVSRGAAALHQPYFGGTLGFELRVDEMFSLLPSVGLFHSPVGTEASGGTNVLNISIGANFQL
jgi:hypothetical protein